MLCLVRNRTEAPNMNPKHLLTTLTCTLLATAAATATERLFTYTYEPETLPKGAWEAEQWVTLRAGRNATVGKEDYMRWQFREEIEYGVTDRYQVAAYFNHESVSYDIPGGGSYSHYHQTGVSFENKYLVLNPAENPVGFSIYLEPGWDWAHRKFEFEQKLIFGQRHGDWKWALNLTHETEWEHNYKDVVGEFEATFGLTRQLSSRWAVGFEMRHHAEVEEYETWEGYAFYLGPVVSYRTERWWAALTVMPQIYGANFEGNPDGNSSLDLDGHERLNVRLLFGFDF